MTRIAVFCGSNFGASDIYRDGAAALGRALARRGIELVFGGTNKGLMKTLADTVRERGGTAHGIVPRALIDKGQQYPDLSRLEIVATRSQRKRRMAEVADGFIAMPGGVGTVEELFEMWVDAQFDGHHKPLGLLNVGGFFDGLMSFVDTMIDQRFLPSAHGSMIIAKSDPEALLDAFESFVPVTTSKWM
jgi:uncharacterized protein (TIGR00730 family)